jgi:MFS family permease
VAGQLLGVLPLSLGIMAPLSGWLSDRVGTRLIALIGLFVLVVSYWNITRLSVQTTTLGFALALLPLGIGMGVFQSPNNSAIMGTVPPHQLGIASGLLAITRTLGQTTGIAVLNALWASRIAVYAPAVPRDELTSAPDAAQVAALHDVGVAAVVLISLALGLGVVGWVRQRRHVERSATA